MATILVVDDDPSARELLVTVLGYAGHQIQQAADGAEALPLAQTSKPELIIADLLMPTMDGFEFVRQLREDSAFSKTPVVFYTASYLQSEARTLANHCGVTDIITKPAEPEQILKVAHSALGQARSTIVPPPLPEFQREHVTLLTAKLSQRTVPAAPRLEAMIDLGLQLISVRNPRQLLGSFCGAARKIIGAKFAAVGILEDREQKLRYVAASGMSEQTAARITSPAQTTNISAKMLSKPQPFRLRDLSGDPQAVGLPSEHPPVHSFLGAPIMSPDRVYGWLCLADKIGASEFSEEDEALAQILAAQVGRIYENRSLYSELKDSVERLENEMVERQRVQEEIRRLNAQLEQRVADRTAELAAANRELEAFSYSVSHDLRGPLRAIIGFSELLTQDAASALPQEAQRHLQRITDSARHMGQLIDDLLDLSQINRQELHRTRVNLSELAQNLLDEFRQVSPERRIETRVAAELWVDGDPNLLRIALENLLRNAWKFTEKTANVRIEVGMVRSTNAKTESPPDETPPGPQPESGSVTFFVKDNGAGFEMAYAHKLFAPFQRLHSTDEFEGTGIGLAIVQRVIVRHGGKIWAEGEVGKGATFYFSLPSTP